MYMQDGVGGGFLQDRHGGDLNYKMVVAPCETGIVAILITKWWWWPLTGWTWCCSQQQIGGGGGPLQDRHCD